MHLVVRTACVLPLALAQLALPALAQTTPAPAELPADTLPPEPEVPHPETPPAPGPAAAWPNTQLAPPQFPLSTQMLQTHLSYGWNPLSITRGGVETPDLLRAVAGSERADNLIRAGQRQAVTGSVLTISGMVISIGTLIVALPIVESNPHQTNDQISSFTAGLLTGVLVGAILTAIGSAIQWAGYHQIVEGVNAYNADLVDGRLTASPVIAIPPR